MRKGSKMYNAILATCLFASVVAAADIRRVKKTTQAPYPPFAMKMRVEGAVKIEAAVDQNGNVEDVKVVSGHPLLKAAAAESVKQWAFESGPSKTTEIVEVVFKIKN